MVKDKKGDKKDKKAASPKVSVKEEVPEEKIDLRKFKIAIEKIQHIRNTLVYDECNVVKNVVKKEPAFTATDVYLEVKHSEIILGQSPKTVVHEKENILLDYEIELSCNAASEQLLDELLSCPIYFTVWQIPGEAEINLYPSRSETSEDSESQPITRKSIESLYEAILGVKWEEETEEEQIKSPTKVKIKEKKGKKGKDKGKDKAKGKDKGKKGKDKESKSSKGSKESKDSKGSKGSKGSKDSKKSKKEVTIDPALAAPVCVGCANLDLLPFFLGKTEINETISLYQEKVLIDDELVTSDNLPQLTVKITIDKPLFGVEEDDKKLRNLLNVTVESIYSLPEFFSEELDYKIATLLPTENLTLKPVCIENGVFKQGLNAAPEFKLWPSLSTINNFSANTPYKIDENIDKIKNKIGASLSKETLKNDPRVTWNILKKCWLTEDSTDLLQKNIIKYRRWPIEIFVAAKIDKAKIDGGGKKGKDKTSIKSKGSITSKASKESKKSKGSDTGSKRSKLGLVTPELQHLMGFVDISSLLYPGVTKTRVTCELRTFQQKELTKETGFDNSYFEPKQPPAPEIPKKETKKGDKSPKKGDKSPTKGDKSPKKGDKASSGKSGKGKDSKKGKTTPKGKVEPEPEPEPEPSQQIFNEKGEPSFIILEFELLKPFQQRRTVSDLSNELHTIIPKKDCVKPSVMNVRFATEFYSETIIKLATEINIEYQSFSKINKDMDLNVFLKYLQETGVYQKLYTTFARSVVLLVKEKFNYNNDFKSALAYINYVSNVYTYLQNILNTQIHNLMSCHLAGCYYLKPYSKQYLFLQTEAIENEAISLAERYHLQALDEDLKNPDLWLNFAVFHLQIFNVDKAFECLKEALAIKVDHRYSLLLFGIILFERNDFYLSESTFLSLVSYHPRFLEGWACLYLFYMKRQQFEGCDFCLEMLTEYKDFVEEREDDYIFNKDGLGWTTSLCNSDNIFYQTALLLIKLKALKFADIALSTDNFTQDGAYRYYQAVILYFAKDYEHALMHLADAQKMHGPDYAVNSLIGHCHFRLGNHQEAKEAYMFIVDAFNRPEDMHMLYMNLSYIYEAEKNLPLARKYMVYVCKYSPTAYSWLMLGILYYKTNNYINAEACLEESNSLDIRLPETWAYLVLLNIKFGKNWEAEQCYTQMLRFNLKNEALLNEVQGEMQKNHIFL